MEKNAENIAKYFQKGDQIIINGEMNVGTHKDSKLARTDIYVQNWEFGQKKKVDTEKEPTDSSSDDDDLPFGV
jgi:single-stranded DNA-binding protein